MYADLIELIAHAREVGAEFRIHERLLVTLARFDGFEHLRIDEGDLLGECVHIL